jgi:hypothetical protein
MTWLIKNRVLSLPIATSGLCELRWKRCSLLVAVMHYARTVVGRRQSGAVMSANRGARSDRQRTANFAVLRWLGVGAAGIGIGAAAWTGAGVASADAGGSASDVGAHSSSAAKPSAEIGHSGPRRQVKSGSLPSAAAMPRGLSARDSGAPRTASPRPDAADTASSAAAAMVSAGSQLAENNPASHSDSAALGVERRRGTATSAASARTVAVQSPEVAAPIKSLVGDQSE